ncbi:MAG: response regulator transcription factor [Verrucomicrobiota bacterium]
MPSMTHDDLNKKRVFLVDDHPLVREWLGHLINQQPDLAVCGEAETASAALREIRRLEPDIAVVDLSLGGSSGIELIKEIKLACPRVEALVLSMHEESTYVERSLRAGARGYVVKQETTKNIVTAIRQVLAGEYFLSSPLALAMTRKFVASPARGGISPVELLSDRELEVFEMLGRGFETRRISEELHIGMKTVQAYCARIKEKLDLKNATALLREAVLWGQREKPRE